MPYVVGASPVAALCDGPSAIFIESPGISKVFMSCIKKIIIRKININNELPRPELNSKRVRILYCKIREILLLKMRKEMNTEVAVHVIFTYVPV